MADLSESLDDQFRTGVELFNSGEYFDAHEVWEEAWMACEASERRFFQSLIQAAVSLYHWQRGNAAGAARLYHSGRKYMEPFRPVYRGILVEEFWDAIAAELNGTSGQVTSAETGRPIIELSEEGAT